MCHLELYSSWNMVWLGRFAFSLPSSGFLNLPPFCHPFLGVLGDPRGTSFTKSLLYPSGTTVSPGVCTPVVDRSVTMHGPRRELLSQICCRFGIHLRFSCWPLFVRITGRSRFTCLQGLYVCFWIQLFVLFYNQSTRRKRPYYQDEVWLLRFRIPPSTSFFRACKWERCPLKLYSLGNMVQLCRFALSLPPYRFFNLPPSALIPWLDVTKIISTLDHC